MAYNANKDVVLKGIGKFIARGRNSKKTLFVDKGQKMQMEFQTDSEELYGGDNLAPIYTYATKNTTKFTFTNATFKISQIGLLTASTQTKVGVSGRRIVTITKDTKTLGVALTNVKPAYAMDCDTGEDVPVSAGGADAPANGIAVTAEGAVSFGAGVTGTKFVLGYDVDLDGVQIVVIADSLAEPVELDIEFTPDDLKSTKQVMLIHVPQARCDGNLTIETARDSASTPEIVFQTLKDDDEKGLMTITLAQLNEQGE